MRGQVIRGTGRAAGAADPVFETVKRGLTGAIGQLRKRQDRGVETIAHRRAGATADAAGGAGVA